MPAPLSRWALVVEGRTIAQGDTVVGALDSVRIVRTTTSLPPGTYTLRAVADTLRAVAETDEANNASRRVFAVIEFPSTGVLDDFARPDAPLAAPWAGSIGGLAVRRLALVQTSATSYAIWNGAAFGPDQEAWMRFDSLTAAAPEHDLLLKVQGTTWTAGAIQVVYSAPNGTITVNTYAPGVGWTRRGGPWKVVLAPGDQLGARALPDGALRVFKNGKKVGETSVAAWAFASKGGRVGAILTGAAATRIAAFGGGDFRPDAGGLPGVVGSGKAPAGAAALTTERADAPLTLALSAAFPNPARGAVAFELELPTTAAVSLAIFDVQGRRVFASEIEERAAGRSTLRWSGTTSAGGPAEPGLYFARATIGGAVLSRRVVITR